ncbi:leucyl-tRNA synthetase [Balneicella halophila]|uniref:Leucine--tRNA ligase n=1 Tax=Balneicella halophila TaxID=1537566 RepID=A0A7L4UQ77_BALHA|nr:leucine--tRNA ligase [Balneicella halophila]PVX51829.1 leucyl-tRNA synthetase [Balneicella halophila]
MEYNFIEVEKKWQKYWENHQVFQAENNSEKPKYYVLDMFPYPSGAGLHVGHPLGYIASDIYARYKRLHGFNVLHPMGYDSFGLPAEQYAIQTGQHPAITTMVNINGGVDKAGNKIPGYEKQLKRLGLSFDWSRKYRTSDPSYYRWTQWIFIQLYNHYFDNNAQKARPIAELAEIFSKEGNLRINAACDADTPQFSANEWKNFSEKRKEEILLQYRLTYLAETEVNWCPELGTVLANDEVVNGVSERGGYPVVRKKMKQWSMRISAYAERLLQGLETIDWTDALKDAQRNWIGKSHGASVNFSIKGSDEIIEVFTTRPDTLFGVSFMVLAPEHELVREITTSEYKEDVENYIYETSKRSERERMAEVKRITGQFTGAYAIHPLTGDEVPIWIGDYVLAGYGTGAVMAVPAGDQRDYDFAKHFNIPIPNIFEGADLSEGACDSKEATLANSEFLNGLSVTESMPKVIAKLEEIGAGEQKTNYRLRDAVFSRQRYWGEPFPVYYADRMPKMLPEECLPLVLPEIDEYLPTEAGDPPLGRAKNWAWDTNKNKVVSNDLIDDKTVFPLELNTMPGWAGSSWYFLRYMDANNDQEFASKEALNYWKDVDLYLGGSEHATGHLLYSRFWQKFLYDCGLVPKDEYAKKLINQGMILGTSALVYRVRGTNQYVSNGLKEQYETDPLRVDVNLVGQGDVLDVEGLKKWMPEFEDAEFILEDGKYIVGREVEKMSKRWYNVVNPDDICEDYGADALRLYEMFLGPLEQSKPWNTQGLSGVSGFIRKLWRLYHTNEQFEVSDAEPTKEELKVLHQMIKKVQDDMDHFSFNTSVSHFMIAVNEFTRMKCNKRAILEPLAILISPYAPHLAEELWEKLGHKDSISYATFPVFEEKYLQDDTYSYPVSFNGKMRFKRELDVSVSRDDVESIILADEETQKWLGGKTPKKIIYVPKKIINIVF